MQTKFPLSQINDPNIKDANDILRSCVHCGFCNSSCPTYLLMGDELDGPRGRIYLIKEMLENDRPASPVDVKHLDRCLGCLSCMTACPSGVNYMHLMEYGRRHIEQTYRRSFFERLVRNFLGVVLPNPKIFKFMLSLAVIFRGFKKFLPRNLRKTAHYVSNLKIQGKVVTPNRYMPISKHKYRVGMLTGCVQSQLNPEINKATIRLLNRHGCEVIVIEDVGCCGALNLHLGQKAKAFKHIKSNVDAWCNEAERSKLDAIIVNTSGCGTTVKDYGHLLRDDEKYSQKAKNISLLSVDIIEFISRIGLRGTSIEEKLTVAYQAPCSLQHGQLIRDEPLELLKACGFEVVVPNHEDLCCGAAGTYHILQGKLSEELQTKKIKSLVECSPDIIATGNVGCMMQLKTSETNILSFPVVHTVELLDWGTGGPKPPSMN